MQKRHSQLTAIIGAPRSGKTHFSMRLAQAYPGNVLAYNVGRPGDFEGYELLEAVSVREYANHALKNKAQKAEFFQAPKVENVRHNGKVYGLEDLPALLASVGGKGKMYRVPNTRDEALFFESFYRKVAGCLFVFDDCRPMFRYGVRSEFQTLFSRMNHHGAQGVSGGVGNDGALIFHQIGAVNVELWDYITNVVIFKTNQPPNPRHIDNDALFELIMEAYEMVKDAPPFSRCEISITDMELVPYLTKK